MGGFEWGVPPPLGGGGPAALSGWGSGCRLRFAMTRIIGLAFLKRDFSETDEVRYTSTAAPSSSIDLHTFVYLLPSEKLGRYRTATGAPIAHEVHAVLALSCHRRLNLCSSRKHIAHVDEQQLHAAGQPHQPPILLRANMVLPNRVRTPARECLASHLSHKPRTHA